MSILKHKLKRSISKTVTVTSGVANLVDIFEIPWNKIGFLDQIEAYNSKTNGATLLVKDSYQDTVTEVSGFETRKEVFIASGVHELFDVDEDVLLLGKVKLQCNVSGFNATIAAKIL